MTLAVIRCIRCDSPLSEGYAPAIDLAGGLVCDECSSAEGTKHRSIQCKDCGEKIGRGWLCDGCMRSRFYPEGDDAA